MKICNQRALRDYSQSKVFLILASLLVLIGCQTVPDVDVIARQTYPSYEQKSAPSVLDCIGILSAIQKRIPCIQRVVLVESGNKEIKGIVLSYPDEYDRYIFHLKNMIVLQEDFYRELLNQYIQSLSTAEGDLSLSESKTVLHLKVHKRDMAIASDILWHYGLTYTRYKLSDLSDPLFAELSQVPLKLSQKELEDLPSAVAQINKKLKQCGISDWRVFVDNSGRFESVPVKESEELPEKAPEEVPNEAAQHDDFEYTEGE